MRRIFPAQQDQVFIDLKIVFIKDRDAVGSDCIFEFLFGVLDVSINCHPPFLAVMVSIDENERDAQGSDLMVEVFHFFFRSVFIRDVSAQKKIIRMQFLDLVQSSIDGILLWEDP